MIFSSKQAGFIQIPILIAILVGLLVVGGGGYVGVKQYQNSQAKKEQDAQEQKLALEQAQTEIEKLKQGIATSAERQNRPEQSALQPKSQADEKSKSPTAPKIIATQSEVSSHDAFCQTIVTNSVWRVTYGPDNSNSLDDAYSCQCSDGLVMNDKATACIQASAQSPLSSPPLTHMSASNPAGQCLPIKKDWEIFVSAYTNIQKEFNSFFDSYTELAFGTKNKPTEFIALLTYNYNHMTSEKSRFTTKASDFRKLVDALPRPAVASNDELQKIKDAYSNSTRNLEKSFDLALQSATVIAEDKDGISTSDLAVSQSLFKDSNTEFYKVSPEIDKAYNVENQFETRMFNDRSKGCLFTFYKDHTIGTTIQAEWDFTQTKPNVEISKDYPPSAATVSIKTTLPVEINEEGNKTVMQLGCSEGAYRNVSQDTLSYKDIYPATRVDANTISAMVRPLLGRSFVTRWCSFTYSGSGPLISSNSAEVRI
ncbi:MAG: hypothetical protein Q8Q10_04965 [bacterium]|nr:hypothetical protein [bacterium]